MATEELRINLIISDDKSTDKVIKKVQVLKDLLDQTAISAGKINVGGGMPQAPSRSTPAGGGTTAAAPTSGKTTYSGRLSQPSGAAAQAASPEATYGGLRGTAARTGSAASDFAEQAQGLGGLVRLYAVFAANIYAVGAAFTVLSEAMNTANMVKSLNQLGAESGVSLGNLAKRLVVATGGAISLRDGMQSVAQASAAGINSDNIIRIGEAANRASLALGISMPDAISRLTRGIVKLEPELLDELGIFTKLDESNRKYAITLGKTVGSLTDFEKRQGFANAVLEETNNKFATIKIDANPYDKLLASFKDLAQTGLDLVNKVLGPIVGFLSQSPVALMTVLAYIGTKLLGKFLPEVGKYREGLKKIADETELNAGKLVQIQEDRRVKAYAVYQKEAMERFELAADTQKKITKLQGFTSQALGAKTTSLVQQNPFLLTPDQLAEIKSQADKLSGDKKSYIRDEGTRLKQHYEDINSLRLASEQVGRDVINREARHDDSRFSQLGANQRELTKLQQESTQRRILSNLQETQSTFGASRAWKDLNAEIAKSKSGKMTIGRVDDKGVPVNDKFDKQIQDSVEKTGLLTNGLTRLKGGFGILANEITKASAALAIVGEAAAIAVAVFEGLDWIFSKNGKEAAATAKAFETVSAAIDTLALTTESIAKKDYLTQISSGSRNASAVAITGLIAATKDALDKAGKEILAASWWDTLKDKVSMLWGGDTKTKSSKAIATTITKVLSSAQEGTIKNSAIAELEALLKGPLPKTADELAKKLKALGGAIVEGQALNITDNLGNKLLGASEAAKELDESLKNASKTLDTIIISAIPTDPIAKLGQEWMKSAELMAKSLDDPQTAMEQLAKLTKDTGKLRIFTPDFSQGVVKNTQDIQGHISSLKILESELKNIQDRLEAPTAPTRRGTEKAGGLKDLAKEEVSKTQIPLIIEYSAAIKRSKDYLEPFIKGLKEEVPDAMKRGAQLVQNAIAKGFAEARAIISSAYAARLGDTEVGIRARAQLAKDENARALLDINAKEGLLDAQMELKKSVELNTIETALNTLEITKESYRKLHGKSEATAVEKQGALEKEKLRLTNPAAYKEQYPEKASKAPTMEDLAKTALRAQGDKIRAQNTVIELKMEDDLAANKRANSDTELANANKISNSRKEINKIMQSGLPYISEETLSLMQEADRLAEINTKMQERKTLELEIDKQVRTIDKTPINSKEFKQASLAKLAFEKQLIGLKRVQEEQLASDEAKRDEDLRTRTKTQAAYETEVANRVAEQKLSNDTIITEKRKQQIEFLKDLGISGAIQLADLEGSLAIAAEKRDSEERLRKLNAQKATAVDLKVEVMSKQTADTPEALIAVKDLTETQTYYDSLIANEKYLSEIKQLSLQATKDMNMELAKQKIAMDSLVSTTESLAAVFGKVGGAIGDTLKSMQAVGDTEATYMIKRKQAQDELAAADKLIDPSAKAEAQANATEKLGLLEKKNTKDQITNNINLLSSSKKMFSEKTAAYKALDIIEKVQHLRRIYENNKELIQTIWNAAKGFAVKMGWMAAEVPAVAATTAATTGIVAAGNVAKAVTAVPTIFAQFSAMMGPWGWAAAAAVVAALGLGGSKGSAPPAGFSAEEQQKVQGTGQEYKNGALVDRAGGVLGDSKAVAKSIKDSMETLGKVFFGVMGSGSSNMLKYLKGIQEATEATAKALVGSTLFGEGATKSASSSSFLGFSKSSTTVADAGIKVSATLGNIAKGLGSIAGYENVTSKSSSFWGLFSSSSSSTNVIGLGKAVQTSIQNIFANVTGALTAAGQALEGSGTRVTDLINQIPIDLRVSSQGLSASEFADKLLSEISVQLNAAAEQAFPYMAQYVKVGEEMYATIARVVKEGETITTGLDMLGLGLVEVGSTISTTTSTIHDAFWGIFKGVSTTVTTSIASIEDRVAKQQQLLKEFDGDSTKFESSVQFYFDNFKTVEDRFQFASKTVAKGFTDLGIPAVKTKKEFDAIVQSLDLNTIYGAHLFAGLMELAPAFDKVAQVSDSTAKLQLELLDAQGNKNEALAQTRLAELAGLSETDAAIKRQIYLTTDLNALNDAKAAQEQKILTLLGKTTEVTRLTRAKELKGMDSNLIATQNYIYALEDEKTARDAATSAVSNTIKSLDGSIKTLKDYQFNLTTGAQGVLTPEQKYAALQQDLMATQAAAMGPTDTPAQLAAQQAAAAKLPTAAAAFLTSSQALYASTDKYTQDLAGVQGMITDTISSLTLSESLAQGQLDVLNSSNGFLSTIDTSLISTNQLMRDFNTTASATNEAFKVFNNPITMVPDATTALINAEAIQLQKDTLAAQNLTNELLLAAQTAAKAATVALAATNATAVANQTETLVQAGIDLQQQSNYDQRNTVGSGGWQPNGTQRTESD